MPQGVQTSGTAAVGRSRGLARRVAGEIVPLGCAVVVGGLYVPLGFILPAWFGILAAVLTCGLAWLGTSYLLRLVRRRPRLRRVYRIALLAHVLFWSVQGVLATRNEPAGPLVDAGASAWKRASAFRAGAAEALFDLPPGTTLAGWGSRPRRLTFPPNGGLGPLGRWGQRLMAARQDDGRAAAPLFREPDATVASQRLGARAIVLRPEDPAVGPPVAFVRMDLVTTTRGLHRAIAAAVADLGIRSEGVLLAAAHTHSGPGGYSPVPLSAVFGTDHFNPAVFAAIRDAGVRAVREAYAGAVAARVSLVRAHDRDDQARAILSRNRRKSDAARIDDRVYGLRIDRQADGEAIAVLLNYAVHPTLMRRRHMGFHRDLAGALEDALADALPGDPLVLFVNGALGDITPREVGSAQGAARAAILAKRFAREAFRPAFDAAPSAGRTRLRMASAQVRRRMATPRLVKGWGGRAAMWDAIGEPLGSGDAGTLAATALALPVNIFAWSVGMPELRVGFSWHGAVGFSLNLEDSAGTDPYDAGAFVFETTMADGSAPERWALLWEPGEATEMLGRAWRKQAAGIGFDDTLVVGLAGGATAYLTTASEFREEGYEAEGTLFGPTAAADVGEALLEALARAGAARRP